MKTGLFIGRFQPFHLGHLSAVTYALRHVDVLVIAIGSSQHGHTLKNPFTAQERAKIIRTALKENDVKKNQYKICLVPDIGNDVDWPRHVLKHTPKISVVFTRSPIVRRLFKKYSQVPVVTIPKKLNVSATELRKSMKKDQAWEVAMSPKAASMITSLGGVARVKSANPKSRAPRKQKS